MSAYERPDLVAVAELETLISHLGEELAGWRRRCLAAEAELKQGGRGRGSGRAAAPLGPELDASRDRVEALERENAELQRRIEAARERVRAMASRLSLVGRGSREGAA